MSLVYVQASTSSNDEEEVEETHQIPSPPHIVMGTESMQADNIDIIVDGKENPFIAYGTTIFGNITMYTSSDEGEEEKRRSKKKKGRKK